MADLRDYLEAANQTDAALGVLREHRELIARGETPNDFRTVALALAFGAEAVALAQREASTRADYVARDLARGVR